MVRYSVRGSHRGHWFVPLPPHTPGQCSPACSLTRSLTWRLTVAVVAVAFLSDRLKLRGVVMLFTLPIAIAGYAVIANVTSARVKYGMTFLMATGLYSSVPPVLVWLSNNSAGHYKRATAAALQLAIANCGGFIAVFMYPAAQGPQYHEGHTVILGLLVAGWFL